MRNKNHNKRINHNNGLKIAIMLLGVMVGQGRVMCVTEGLGEGTATGSQGGAAIPALPFLRTFPADSMRNTGRGRGLRQELNTSRPQRASSLGVTPSSSSNELYPSVAPGSQVKPGQRWNRNALLPRLQWGQPGGPAAADAPASPTPRSRSPEGSTPGVGSGALDSTAGDGTSDAGAGGAGDAEVGAASSTLPSPRSEGSTPGGGSVALDSTAGDGTSDAGAGGAGDAEVRAASSTPRSPSPVGAIVDLPAGGDKATVPEPVKTPLQTPRGLQGTPSTPSYPRVAPEERGIGSEGDDDTESTVSDLDLDFDPNALLLEAKERLAGLGICEYAPAYEGIPILDRLMEIILKGDFQKEYQECLPEDKMTPEQLVAKIVVSYNSINSVYRTRELEDKAFDVDYIIEVGSTNAINLHHTKHLHNGEQYLTSIIGMLHELNAPISQYINAELPALEEIVDNAVKITKRENLRGIKDQLTILQGSLKDAKQSRKNNLKALKELNNVLKGLKSTMDKFTAKTPHQSDEALKNFKLMQDYLDKINNLIEEGKQKDAAIEKITAEINEVETQIASLQGEIDGLEDTCTEVIKQTKLYEGEMRVIYAGIQDLIEQHKADLVLAQEVYGSKSSVE